MIGVKLPDGRTVNVNTTDPQEAAKAARRLLAREAIQKSGMGAVAHKSALDVAADRGVSGMTFGLSDVLDGLTQGGITGVKNLITEAKGGKPTYGMADAYAAERDLQKAQTAKHPVAGLLGNLAGALGNPTNEAVARFVASGVPKATGLLASTALPAQAARSGLLAAVEGGVSGATQANPGSELAGAGRGAATGAVVGTALPFAAAGAGKAVEMAKGAGKTIARAANKLTGGALLDPGSEAADRLVQALKADGATPQQLKDGLNTWLKTGSSSPTLMDLATALPSGGANTLKLLSGAAMKGQAAGMATKYADSVEAALPDNVINRARLLTEDARPAAEVADELAKTQGGLATEQYAEPYATPVKPTPEVLSAVADAPGQAAVKRAIKAAVANRDYEAAGRLQTLLDHAGTPQVPVSPTTSAADASALNAKVAQAAADQAPLVTAGDLDRVKIALGKTGRALVKNDASDIGGGLFGRANDIDSALGAVPEIQPARATYKAMQAQRDALDAGRGAMSAMPDDYEAAVGGAMEKATPFGNPKPVTTEDIQNAAAIGHRNAITDAVGQPAAGATGVLNKLRGSPNQIRNQDVSFGPEDAQSFRDAVSNEIQRVANARYIDPTTNSRSADRISSLVDMGDLPIPKVPKSLTGMVFGAVNKLRQGATLTDAERASLVSYGLAKPEDFIPLLPEDVPHPAVSPKLLPFLPTMAAHAGASAGARVDQ